MSSLSNTPSQPTDLNKLSFEQLVRGYEQSEQAGNYRRALEIGRAMVSQRPTRMHGHYAVGSALCHLGLLDEADTALRKAIARDPNRSGIYIRHGEVLNRLGHSEAALEAVETASRLAPNDPKVMAAKAMVMKLCGHLNEAYTYLDQLIADGCDDPNVRSIHAVLAGELGKADEGIIELEKLVNEADQKVWIDPFMHSAILMHLSRIYDKVGRYDEAFAAAKRAGDMRNTDYDPEQATQTYDLRLSAWSPERMAKIPRSRVNSDKPVFILGMPRSGTSLVEQIIASHPLAYGGGELGETYLAARELSEPNAIISDRSQLVEQLKKASLERCARKILKTMEKASGKMANGKPYAKITDKLPNNYEFVGMIWAMLPNAKIIHCKRNPLDTCLSCYLLDFVGDRSHGYSYNLKHLAHQYRLYQRMMDHWKTVMPDSILDVEYEELVANPEDGARRIVEYVGLEWDERCSKSHETKRAVSTLSSDQVRKPMYTSSVGRWRNYEGWIGELVEGLGSRE